MTYSCVRNCPTESSRRRLRDALGKIGRLEVGCGLTRRGLSPPVTDALHVDEIPIDAELVGRLVSRVMPTYADAPIRRLASSGSTNALFRLGADLLVRLPRLPGGSETIAKEARWLPVLGPLLPVPVPQVVAVFDPDYGYPERWSVIRWIAGAHPVVVDPQTPVDSGREELATNLSAFLDALRQAEIPPLAVNKPDLQSYRGQPLATMDHPTRENIERCRGLAGFGFDLDAAERIWADAMKLPESADRSTPRWYHGDMAAENLLVRDDSLAAVLDFGGLSVGDPTVDLVVDYAFFVLVFYAPAAGDAPSDSFASNMDNFG